MFNFDRLGQVAENRKEGEEAGEVGENGSPVA